MSRKGKAERARIAAIEKRFGRLKVLSFFQSSAAHNRAWYFRCQCGCGRAQSVACHRVLSGDAKTCSHCVAKAAGIIGNVFTSAEYKCWANMRNRCNSPACKYYPSYGGRGIKVCPRWMRGENGLSGFLCFLQDMGKRPTNKRSIGRIDNDAGYSPDNCRWETHDEQMLNRRNTWRMVDGTPLAIAAREVGITPHLAIERLQRGESARRALRPIKLKKPLRRKVKITSHTTWLVIKGKRIALQHAAIRFGVEAGTLRARIFRGIPHELAVLPRRINATEGGRYAA